MKEPIMTKDLNPSTNISKLYKEISNILNTARANVYKAVNFAMVTSYWSIGQLIVEDEQNGNERQPDNRFNLVFRKE